MSLLKAAEVEINFTQIKLWGQIDFLKSSLRKSSVHILYSYNFLYKNLSGSSLLKLYRVSQK